MQPLVIVFAGPYNLLYALGFGVAVGLAWREGHRRGWPRAAWLAILAACVAGGIVGSKLFAFDLAALAPGGKTFLGGLLGGSLAFCGAARLVRFDPAAADALAPAIPAGLAVGRIGCFLAGCCFGVPTALPWGVAYAPGTEPFAAQLALGLIGPTARTSLPVHPTQLYEAALDLALAAAVWRWRDRFRRPRSAFLAMVAAYAGIRFGIEFWRAGADAALGLKTVQWTVLAAGLLVLAALWIRERTAPPRPAPAAVSGERAALLAALVLLFALMAHGWLTPLERLVAVGAALPSVAAFALRYVGRPLALAPAGAAALFAFQRATVPVTASLQTADTLYPRTYVAIGASGMAGEYEESCGGMHQYAVGGASIGLTRELARDLAVSGRLQWFTGRDEEQGQNGVRQTNRGAAVSGTLDTRWIGLTGGVTGGTLIIDGDESGLLPVAGIRLGRRAGFHFDGRVMQHEPAAAPAPVVQLGFGQGLGRTGSEVRAGLSDAGFFVTGLLVTRGGLEVEPFGAGASNTAQLGVTVRQRLGRHRRPAAPPQRP